jgi:bleomycin hydrolase
MIDFKACASVILCALPALGILSAQTGGLAKDVISDIQQAGILDDRMEAVQNALTSVNLRDIALNHDFMTEHNELFSHKINTKGVTDQHSSGRCWLFAVLNTLRPRGINKYGLDDFEFSQTYLFFWDKLEKSNTFLEYVIETADRGMDDREVQAIFDWPVGDGGYWWYVMNLVKKYGAIPREAMPETWNSKNSWTMNDFIVKKLRENAIRLRDLARKGSGINELRREKTEMLKTVYQMLVLHLGEPPREFVWRYKGKNDRPSMSKTYTPLEYFRDVVGTNMEDYIVLMHYPGKENNRVYQFARSRNIYDTEDPKSVNVDIDLIKNVTMRSVMDSTPVYFACDIGPDKYKDAGILSTRIYEYDKVYGVKFEMSKEDRIRYFESTGNHAMVFIGVDVQKGDPVKWLVEDSHGKDSGSSGYWTMYNDWFEEYLYEVVVHKKYLPREIAEIWKQMPIMLPVWDPMVMIMNNTQ